MANQGNRSPAEKTGEGGNRDVAVVRMKPRHAAVLALVALSVLATGCWTSGPAPPNTAPQIKKAKVQAVIDTDPNIQRIRKLEHVT